LAFFIFMKKILSLFAMVAAFAANAQTPQSPEIAARSY